MTNSQEQNQPIKILEAIPSDKLYLIHDDLRKYHNKWSQDQVMELADTSGIENFYTTAQYLTRTVPIVGAGLVAKGYTEAGIVTAGISLYVDYLITSGKEKLFKSEEKKKKLIELNKDTANLYDRYQELIEILKPLRNSDSLPELNKLLQSLREEIIEISKRGEINGEENQNKWENRLSYIFWSLRQDKSSNIKELILLNNGLKFLDSWNSLPLKSKIWSELSRLFISLRESDVLWIEWKKEWEKRRSEHEKIKHLTEILQTAISEYKQGISTKEIEKSIRINNLKLAVVRLYQEFILLQDSTIALPEEINNAFSNYQENISKSTKSFSSLEQFLEELQTLPINLDEKSEQALTDLKTSLQKEIELKKTAKVPIKDNSLEKIEIVEQEDIQQEQIIALIEQHPKKE